MCIKSLVLCWNVVSTQIMVTTNYYCYHPHSRVAIILY